MIADFGFTAEDMDYGVVSMDVKVDILNAAGGFLLYLFFYPPFVSTTTMRGF
jgi:hypothetical protein